jgi:hypothetical protein
MKKIQVLLFVAGTTFPFFVNAQDKRPPAGAVVPFITYEAEAGANKTNGNVVHMTTTETNIITPEMEASGRAFVDLAKQGNYLEITSRENANTIVIRFCTPDAPLGGGANTILHLYVNNVKQQTLVLNNRHAWLYGSKNVRPQTTNLIKDTGNSDEKWQYGRQDVNGQSNDPRAGAPHVYWDEAHFFLTKALKKGDRLKLQRDAVEGHPFCRIDLVELEQAGKALPPPPAGTFISVTDFGATGSDSSDDTEAITACIAEATKTGKTVWIPAGTFYQNRRFILDGVKVQGAGMWYAKLMATVEGDNWSGNAGFILKGKGPAVSDLYCESIAHTRRSTGGKFFTGNPDNWAVKNVWMQYGNCGFWMSGATNGEISNNRIRSTYADAINVNNGAQNIMVVNNHIRGNGDDGIAILSEIKRPQLTANITVRRNTVTAIWWGHNIDLAGGYGHLIDSNYMADNAVSGCFTINLPAAFPMHPTRLSTIKDNLIERGGGDRIGMQKRGAAWIYAGSTTIDSVSFVHNTIRHSIFRAIHLTGSFEQNMIFRDNIIDNVSLDAVFIDPVVKGHGLFVNNTIKGLKPGFADVKNTSKTFIVD